jgi:hypothetical protein
MSDFKKPYEYEEEKGMGGLLMLFFVMLVTVEVLLGLMFLLQGYAVLKAVPYLGPAFLVVGIGYLLFILTTCFTLRRASRYAVSISKIFLVARALFLTPVYVLLFTRFSRNLGLFPRLRLGGDLAPVGLIVPLAYILLFSGLWYYYLSSSRRVRQLMKTGSAGRDDHVGAPPS